MKINKYISIWISLAIISFSGITIAAETNDSMKGMELYNSKCKKCHGAEAKGKKLKRSLMSLNMRHYDIYQQKS